MRALLAIAAALMLWEGFVRLTGLPPYLLPGPLAVGRALWVHRAELAPAAMLTAWETLLGLGLGAALGIVIVGAFFSVSAVVIARAGQISPKLVMVAALATYVVKIVALGLVLTFLPRDWIFDTRWMAAGVGLGLFVWLGAHMRYVWTTQIYYVDPH